MEFEPNAFPSAGYYSTAAAVPIIADRIALPEVAGRVDLLGALPPAVAALYADACRCMRPVGEAPRKSAGRARVFASHIEYIRLLQRMRTSGMLKFTTTPKVVNGLFATPKSDGKLRLIIDARAANNVFADPPDVELPSPELLARLQAPQGETIWVAKSDLSDFFYRFRVPEWMLPLFALPAIISDELGLAAEFGAGVHVYPCLTVVAMGWSHSVFLTQTAHEHFLDTRTTLRPADRITATSDLRIDRVRHGVYIDDVFVLGPVRDEVGSALVHYVATANASDLPVKPSKVQGPDCEGMEVLGMEIDGRNHTVGTRVSKLHALCIETRQMVVDGHATGRELAELVGRWTWSMLPCRPALSAFCAVYRFIETAHDTRFYIWPSVARELRTAVALAPLLFARISAPWHPHVLASDASLAGQGVCLAAVPEPAVIAAAAHSGVLQDADPVVEAALNAPLMAAVWHTAVSARWREPGEHINQFELRATSTALRRALSSPSSTRHRILLLSDSQVAVGALSKGRTSAPHLLRRLRPITAALLASGVQLYARWIPSELNPADGPSRYFN
jgi:hypothetical protein